MLMDRVRQENLSRFGLRFGRGGVHLARSMMLEDLRQLFQHVPDAQATREDFARAILVDNCLGKRSSKTRQLSLRHLIGLYTLNPRVPIFRGLRFFWERDAEAQPLLACLVAFARDAVLRSSAPFIWELPRDAPFVRPELERYLDTQQPGRFRPATLQSTAQNLATTWTHAGHLRGTRNKRRAAAQPTAGATALALLIAWSCGGRGELLFESPYVKLLDCPPEQAIDLAEQASRRGWITCNRLGTVIDVRFPQLLTAEEQEYVCEQG